MPGWPHAPGRAVARRGRRARRRRRTPPSHRGGGTHHHRGRSGLPSSSPSRSGTIVSKPIIARLEHGLHAEQPEQRPGCGAASRQPAETTRGTSRDPAHRPAGPTGRAGSRSSTTTRPGRTTPSTTQTSTGSRSALSGCGVPPDEPTGGEGAERHRGAEHGRRPRESSWSTSAPGRARCTVSTYQASSGPESSARKTPCSRDATARPERVGGEVGQGGQDADGARDHQDRLAAHGVGEAAGRQLEQQDRHAADGRGAEHLGEGEAPVEPHRPSIATTSPTGNQRMKVSSRKTRWAVAAGAASGRTGARALTRRPPHPGRDGAGARERLELDDELDGVPVLGVLLLGLLDARSSASTRARARVGPSRMSQSEVVDASRHWSGSSPPPRSRAASARCGPPRPPGRTRPRVAVLGRPGGGAVLVAWCAGSPPALAARCPASRRRSMKPCVASWRRWYDVAPLLRPSRARQRRGRGGALGAQQPEHPQPHRVGQRLQPAGSGGDRREVHAVSV